MLLQYGQCLFETGWVGELGRLAEQQATKAERDALGISWSLLKWMADVETPPLDEQRNILEAGMVMLRSRWPALDSTEMNILCAIVSQSTAFVGCFSHDDWGALYEHLIDEGMVWEFRDLVQSIPLTHWAPPLHSGGRSAGPGYAAAAADDRVPEQLFGRWNGGGGDDDLGSLEKSTLFALLDVSTTLCLLAMKEADSDAPAERWLGVARRHAAELTSRDEGHMVSRPYLRWVIAGVFKTDTGGGSAVGSTPSGGTLRRGSFAVSAKLFPFFTPVIYIPSSDEAPEWRPLRRRPDAATVEAVNAVLRAAEGMGDQPVQAGCLHELMHQRAEEADDVMRALHELWTVVAGAPVPVHAGAGPRGARAAAARHPRQRPVPQLVVAAVRAVQDPVRALAQGLGQAALRDRGRAGAAVPELLEQHARGPRRCAETPTEGPRRWRRGCSAVTAPREGVGRPPACLGGTCRPARVGRVHRVRPVVRRRHAAAVGRGRRRAAGILRSAEKPLVRDIIQAEEARDAKRPPG